VLSGTLSAPIAWAIAQALYVVFGALAYSAIRRYQSALIALNPSEDILQAIRLYPSLATLPGRFFRLGSVLVPPLATGISWAVELLREQARSPAKDSTWWLGMLLTVFVLVIPYLAILISLKEVRLWSPQQQAAGAASPH
jgi:hypothetical protein